LSIEIIDDFFRQKVIHSQFNQDPFAQKTHQIGGLQVDQINL
jgi:hypothetical protein